MYKTSIGLRNYRSNFIFITKNYNVNEELIDSFGRNIDKLKSKGAGVKYDEVQLYNDASEFTGIS